MRTQQSFQQTGRGELHRPLQTKLTLGSRWEGPTLQEFMDRVEHEFGASTDVIGMLRAGANADDSLAPADVRELCSLLGVPAEDFGV